MGSFFFQNLNDNIIVEGMCWPKNAVSVSKMCGPCKCRVNVLTDLGISISSDSGFYPDADVGCSSYWKITDASFDSWADTSTDAGIYIGSDSWIDTSTGAGIYVGSYSYGLILI